MITATRFFGHVACMLLPAPPVGRRAFVWALLMMIFSGFAGVAQPVRIMPLGNSITQADANHNSYRRALWQKLQAGGYTADFVGSQNTNFGGPPPIPDFDLNHEGHWGWRADELLGSILGWAQAHTPDIVLLHAGSNDIFQNQSAASTRDELGLIIDRLRQANPAVKVIVAQVIPNAQAGANSNLMAFNALLPALVDQKTTPQSRVILVNQHTGFVPATDSYDGTHPNAAGEEKMATIWYQGLRTLLAAPLPVTLTSFTARATPEAILLSWETASEISNAGFQLERSTDGQQFVRLGFVAGHGSASAGARYHYRDRDMPARGGLFYRLIQTDTDGQTTFSRVVTVGRAETQGLAVYPVPATDWVTLEGLPREQSRVQVYDTRGGAYMLPVSTSGQLDIRALPPGFFLVRVGTSQRRFIKQP